LFVFKKEVFKFFGAVAPPFWAGHHRAGVCDFGQRRRGV